MQNERNDRISAMIAAGVDPMDAVAATDATDAIEAAKAAVAAREHSENIDDEMYREQDELNDALEYGRMTSAQYDGEYDLLRAYATIARDTGATIAQVRDVARSLGAEHHTNLTLDELVAHGYVDSDEAQGIRDDLADEAAVDVSQSMADKHAEDARAAGLKVETYCAATPDIDARFAAYDEAVLTVDADDLDAEYDEHDDDFPMWLEYNDIEGLTAPMEFDDPYDGFDGIDAMGCDYTPE